MTIGKTSIIVRGMTIHFEIGHTYNEYINNIHCDDLWDFLFEDFLTGAVEPSENMLYWYIGGRFYETNNYINN